MIRIYCQYSIGGFKIFNLNVFPHTMHEGKYVFISEIQKGLDGEKQSFFLTSNNNCDLDQRIVTLFSMRTVSMMLLHNIGSEANETVLFLDDLQTQTAFAFCTKEKADISVLQQIAATWTSEKKNELIRRLQMLVGLSAVNDEQTFAFYESKWNKLVKELLDAPLPLGKLRQITNKNLLIYLSPNKSDILKQANIHYSLSTFITIPGNEATRKIERRNRIIAYTATGIALTVLIGTVLYVTNK